MPKWGTGILLFLKVYLTTETYVPISRLKKDENDDGSWGELEICSLRGGRELYIVWKLVPAFQLAILKVGGSFE